MILATLIVGGITAYWFGLRPGAWAAAATFVLCLAAAFRPDLATAIHLVIALGVVVVCLLGPRQERPPDAVRATRWVRGAVGQAAALVRMLVNSRKDPPRPPSDKN